VKLCSADVYTGLKRVGRGRTRFGMWCERWCGLTFFGVGKMVGRGLGCVVLGGLCVVVRCCGAVVLWIVV
jgi:hypothetical protein